MPISATIKSFHPHPPAQSSVPLDCKQFERPRSSNSCLPPDQSFQKQLAKLDNHIEEFKSDKSVYIFFNCGFIFVKNSR